MSWGTYFMSVALLSSFRSKDKKTQNGACITNDEKRIVGVGYNGLPRGLNDDVQQFWCDDDDCDILNSKHTYVIHAEQNAIHNRISQNLKGCTLYVTSFPCKECAKAICQNGIKRVVYLYIKPHHEKENQAVEIMFDSAGIEYEEFDDIGTDDEDFITGLLKLKNVYYN
jgi:dCMP deaminase